MRDPENVVTVLRFELQQSELRLNSGALNFWD